MGKSSGGVQQTPSTQRSQVTQTNLPEYARPYYERLMERTEAESKTDYQPYPDPRLADVTPDQQSAFAGIRGLTQPGQIGTATNIADMWGNTPYNSGYTAQNFDGGDFRTQYASYMNPYLDQVLDRGIYRINQQYNEDVGNRTVDAAKAGAFGGSRHGIMDSLAMRDRDDRIADFVASQSSQAYNQAQSAFDADRRARLQAQDLSEQSLETQEQLAQRAFDLSSGVGLKASDLLGSLGKTEQDLDLQRYDALGRVGDFLQQHQQAGLDIGFSDFINQRDYERQQLNFLSGILRGVPVTAQSEVTSYQPGPNPYSGLIGAGITALGASKLK